MLRPSLLLLTLIACLCGTCQAQVMVTPMSSVPPPPPTTEPPKLDPETERKALDLVETLSEQVLNLHAPANRVRAQTQVADLLWGRDEKRARTLFNTAVSQLANEISELDYGDSNVYN